jgi:hypothetical protein
MRSGFLIGRPLSTGTSLSTPMIDMMQATKLSIALRPDWDSMLLSISLIVERDDGELT